MTKRALRLWQTDLFKARYLRQWHRVRFTGQATYMDVVLSTVGVSIPHRKWNATTSTRSSCHL